MSSSTTQANRAPGRSSSTNSSKSAEEKSSTHSGLISKPAALIASVSRVLSPFPYIGEVAAIVSPVASFVSKLAGTLGYNRPTNLEPRRYLKPVSTDITSAGMGQEVINRLALDPECQVTNSHLECDPCDYALFENYKLLPALLSVSRQDDSDAVGSVLFDYPVAPWTCHYTHPGSVSTQWSITLNHSANLALRHMWWRGGMKYKIIAFTQPFVSTRVRVTWYPSSHHSDPTPSLQSGNYYSEVFDITGTTIFEFTIPYLKDVKYQYSVWPQYMEKLQDDLIAHNTINGIFQLSVVNPISSPDITNTFIDYVLFASCAEDMMFVQPVPLTSFWKAPSFIPSPTPTIGVEKDTPLGLDDSFDIRAMFRTPFKPIHPAKSVIEHKVNFGEIISDWRTYWHRYRLVKDHVDSPTLKTKFNQLIATTLPGGTSSVGDLNMSETYSWHTQDVVTDASTCLYDSDMFSFHQFFQFRRGSKRFIIEPPYNQTPTSKDSVSFEWTTPIAQFLLTGNLEGPPQVGLSGNGTGRNSQKMVDRPVYEMEVPFFYPLNYFCESLFQRDIDFYPRARYILTPNTESYSSTMPIVNHAIGDDYTWICPKSPGIWLITSNIGVGKDFPLGLDDGAPLEGVEHPVVNEAQELTQLADVASIERPASVPQEPSLWIPPAYEKAEISSILSRWYQYTWAWSSTDALGSDVWSMSFPEDLFNTQPFLMEKINNFQYFRGRVRLSLKINSNKMTAGGLMFSWLPHYSPRNQVTSTDTAMVYQNRCAGVFADMYQASLNPCMLLDASNNIPIEIDIPSITPAELLNTAHVLDPANNGWFGAIHAYVLSPLRLLDGTPTTVYVTVGVQFVDAELYGPTVNLQA